MNGQGLPPSLPPLLNQILGLRLRTAFCSSSQTVRLKMQICLMIISEGEYTVSLQQAAFDPLLLHSVIFNRFLDGAWQGIQHCRILAKLIWGMSINYPYLPFSFSLCVAHTWVICFFFFFLLAQCLLTILYVFLEEKHEF